MDDLNNTLLNNLSIIYKNEKCLLLGFNDLTIYHSQLFQNKFSNNDLISIVCCFDNKYNICLIFTLNKLKKNIGLSILDIEELNPGFPSFIQNKFIKFEVILDNKVIILASHNNRGLLKFELKSIHEPKINFSLLINEFEDFNTINRSSHTLYYENIFVCSNLNLSEKIYASTNKFLDVLDMNKKKPLNKFEFFKNTDKNYRKSYNSKENINDGKNPFKQNKGYVTSNGCDKRNIIFSHLNEKFEIKAEENKINITNSIKKILKTFNAKSSNILNSFQANLNLQKIMENEQCN